jgi:tetratricopeptide (TPR) repeat protein
MDSSNRIDELEQKFIENPRRYFAPLANEYRKAGNPHQAIAICRAHLSQLPGHMSGQIVYGQALFEGGEYDQAQTVFENALAMDRENLVALRHLGDLALRKGETAAARQWYSKILEIDPKDATVIALVDEIDSAAEAQTSTTDAEPASTSTPEAVQPMPEPAAVHDHFHNDEEDKLIAEELGYPVPPAHAFVTETMAELYLAQGFRDRALSVYRQLVSIRPDDERLRTRLAELEQSESTGATVSAEQAETEPVEARREEPPSIESPESPREEEPAPSIEAPTPAEEQAPSEESDTGQSPSIDSPPSAPKGREPESVDSVVGDEPRPEPEGSSALENSASGEDTLRTVEFPPEPVAADSNRAVTVSEFFAALGRRKPAAHTSGFSANGTGRSGSSWSPDDESSSASDAKAAAALAGAFGGAPPTGFMGSPPAPSPATGKESEEDVARFRAWLDGLTT